MMNDKKKAYTYKDAGVDIEKGDALVEKIKARVKSTYGKRVKSGVGGFACLYECADRYLAAGTDGVGTKLKIAQELNQHKTIGIDLVAMCVNDILCTGARPLFFMDYLATGKLDLGVGEDIIEGVVEGCLQSEAALIGGETAEMPGMYQNGEYDLAGFSVGEVYPQDILDGSLIKEGDKLIGLQSSGFHSNGFSLIRKLIEPSETELLEKVLVPTRIYWKAVKKLLEQKLVHSMAHITGGGFSNIARMNRNFNYQIDNDSYWQKAPAFMKTITERSGLKSIELYRTFNMGVGLVMSVDKSAEDEVRALLSEKKIESFSIGTVQKGTGDVILNDGSII